MKIVRTACAVIAIHDVLCIGSGLLTSMLHSEAEQDILFEKLTKVVDNPNQCTLMWAINQLEWAEIVFGHNLGVRLLKK